MQLRCTWVQPYGHMPMGFKTEKSSMQLRFNEWISEDTTVMTCNAQLSWYLTSSVFRHLRNNLIRFILPTVFAAEIKLSRFCVLLVLLVDINECNQREIRQKCKPKGATCHNTPGSYKCRCKKGFEMGEHHCEGKGIFEYWSTIYFFRPGFEFPPWRNPVLELYG